MYEDVVALTGCARSSLNLCASTSGAIAGCIQWKVRYKILWAESKWVPVSDYVHAFFCLIQEGSETIDCTTLASGKRVSGRQVVNG